MPRKTTFTAHSQRSEKAIEHYFCEQMRSLGFPCVKQFNPYDAGWPDRLVVLRDYKVIWVEFKSTGEKPTKLQQLRHQALTDLGHQVFVISSREEAESIIAFISEYLTI